MKNSRVLLMKMRDFIVRHKVKIFDAGFVIISLAVAALFAFEVNVFVHEAEMTAQQETVELNELMVLMTLLMAGILFYIWRRAREHKRENERRTAAEKEVLKLALQDPLTGLPNRRQFDDALKSSLQTLPTAPKAHAIFLLDLNGFKKINDVFGHPIGDQVLMHVGARLLRAVRDGDLVSRLGGDEFAILARNVDGAEGAAIMAQRIIDCIAPPIAIGSNRHPVGTSIGVTLSPNDGVDPTELLRRADVALYRAKAERRSAVRFFETEMDARLLERAAMERALRDAVEDDSLVVRFQPTGQVLGRRITAFEALMRWPHPTEGELEPERFLPIAAEAGFLATITERLLAKACVAAAEWPAEIQLAFNLPSALLSDTTFGLKILKTLANTHFPPNRLDLEIDEGALIRDTEAAQNLLGPLRAAGVSIVADHFGTGYSDLQNLQRLKLDRIKIDRTFIAAMNTDRQAAVLVKALIGIGQGLDLAVIADGVVTEEQQSTLESQGCNQAQGPLYGGPVTAEEALDILSASKAPSLRVVN